MTDIATLRTRLEQALEARHRLSLGTKPEQVQQTVGGVTSMVTYTRANLGDLIDYIAELRADIHLLSTGYGIRRPIHFL